jgi:hypothetical protein
LVTTQRTVTERRVRGPSVLNPPEKAPKKHLIILADVIIVAPATRALIADTVRSALRTTCL